MLINPQTSPSPLLARQRISVADEGEMVKMTLGNVEVSMSYETGLQLSAWLRIHSKRAKRNAGDTSRQWRTVAILEGLEA